MTITRRCKLLPPPAMWEWTTLSPALAVLIVFIVTFFDPFGLESATKRQSAIIIYKIYAALYPDKMRDNISVVLLDDATLQNWKEPWPPSHRLHADVLSTLLSFKPAAVLIDFVFLPRQGDDFERTEAVITKAKTPLFMVTAGWAAGSGVGSRSEIFRLAEMPGTKLSLVSADVGDPQQPLYPLRNNKEFKPAALALYQTICKKIKDATCDEDDVSNNGDKMEVAWGLKPSEFNCLPDTLSDLCEDVFPSPLGRALQLLWEGVSPIHWRPTDPMRIPYHARISTNDLLDGGQRSKLDGLLRGKVVIYGANVEAQNDNFFSPVHGPVPGAFIHAMALDNLLTFGKRYIRQGASHETYRRHWTEYQPSVLILLAAMVIIWRRRRLVSVFRDAHMLGEADDCFLRWVSRTLICVVIVIGLVEFLFCRISPINWLALIVVVHVAHRVERWFFNPVAWTRSGTGSAEELPN